MNVMHEIIEDYVQRAALLLGTVPGRYLDGGAAAQNTDMLRTWPT
jgi:hypothetical protein